MDVEIDIAESKDRGVAGALGFRGGARGEHGICNAVSVLADHRHGCFTAGSVPPPDRTAPPGGTAATAGPVAV